ncbi:MAG: lipopolysaccharide heptosyltransferase II [Planctomycetes bacterium]|nr:lipopolysaccharide heptosyltransferase II [Planctomycetota bacterium]
MDAPNTLIVRLPNPVGDVVMTTPLLRCLREAYSDSRIVVAGKPIFEPLLADLSTIDTFLPLPLGVREQARALRTVQADLILLLPNSWSSALAARLAGIPRRIGRRAQGRGILLTTRLPVVGAARPMTRVYLEMLAALHIEVPQANLEPHTELVCPAGTGTVPQYLGVAPGAAFGPSKCYPLTQLVPAVDQLARQTGLQPLLIGSPHEQELLGTIAKALRNIGQNPVLPMPGDLKEAKQRIRSCALIVTMDSGARHIAAALGVPQVVLYGPTHPEWSAHALDTATILRRDELNCLNCHEKVCPIDHRCMTRIAPEQVVAAGLACFGKKRERAPEPGTRS